MNLPLLTFDDFVTASGKYPERLTSPYLTEGVKDNIEVLRAVIIAFLAELNIVATISSGFRPPTVNEKTKNSAKNSLHMRGLAVDLVDTDGSIKRTISLKPHLLAKYKLWMEDPSSAQGWCHLDLGIRPDRAVRIFKP